MARGSWSLGFHLPLFMFNIILLLAFIMTARGRSLLTSIARTRITLDSIQSLLQVQTLPNHETESSLLTKSHNSANYGATIESKIKQVLNEHLSIKQQPTLYANQELVDWLTFDEKVIATVTRKTVHQHNLLHRGIGVIVINPQQQIHMHKRSANKRLFPSMLDMFVGGVCSSGECPDITLVRELSEELGLSIPNQSGIADLPRGKALSLEDLIKLKRDHSVAYRLGTTVIETDYNHCIVHCYSMHCNDALAQSVNFNDGEVEWGQWTPLEEIQRTVATRRDQFVPDGSRLLPPCKKRTMLPSNMNAVPNSFRQMPFAEIENDHTFRVFRHFPELRKSVPVLKTIQTQHGRNWKDPQPKKKEIPREVTLKSTHRLDDLKKSASLDGSLLTDFQRVLFEGRSKRMQSLALVPSTPIQSSRPSSSSSSSSSPAKLDPPSPNASTNSTSTIACLRSANEKLTRRSLSYDSRDPISSLLGFEGQALDKEELNVQMRRCLNIWLTKEELDALFVSMDADGSGKIDGVEFVRYFFMLGNKARLKIHIDISKKLRKQTEDAKKQEKEQLLNLKRWEADQIAQCTPEESDHALQKLAYAAVRCDPSEFINHIKLQGFERFLSPFEFKYQLEKAFDIRLTAGESGGLLKKFSTLPGEHCVDGHLFLCQFYVFQQQAWKAHKKEMEKFAKRRERIKAMGQRVDSFMPSFLGR